MGIGLSLIGLKDGRLVGSFDDNTIKISNDWNLKNFSQSHISTYNYWFQRKLEKKNLNGLITDYIDREPAPFTLTTRII